jgi:superfamily II DNA or RNA helicase
MDTEIGHKGYSIPLAKLPPHFLKEIRTDLFVKPIENPNFQSTTATGYPVFRVSKTKIYMPRYYAIEKYGQPLKNMLSESEHLIDLEFKGTLREVQLKTIEETLKVYSEYGGGLISLDTGLGKTVVALKLISLIKQKTLILVHADFLLEQWIDRIKMFLPTARVGIIKQEKCQWENVDICVGMIQSIIKRDYPSECFKSFGHMCIDECHHISSRSFSSIFFKIQTKYMVGLSATPERKDGLSKVIYWFLGPQIVNIKRESGKPTIEFVYTDVSEYSEKLNNVGKVNNPTMITDLTINQKRNELIIKTVVELLKSDRKILILSDRRSHCEYLLNQLTSLDISAGVYLGGMKSESREISVNCKVIIGTYQASGEGFDVPDLDTLILATPKSDVAQPVGRILRQKNPNFPLVIDITDRFSIFNGQFSKRKRFYKKNEFQIK